MHVTRPTFAWLLPLLSGAALTGCDYHPTHGELSYALSESTLEKLQDYPSSAAQLEGALEMYFGTPRHPSFLLTGDWVDESFDPNYPQFPADDYGSGEITDEQFDAIVASNEMAFRRELEWIENGEYSRVIIRSAPSLKEAWDDLVAAYEAGLDGGEDSDVEPLSEEDFKAEARDLLVNFYPRLRDSAELYRQQCLHCHGNSGGGDGPTAEFLNPKPRDYRKGVFKFTAVKDKAAPRRSDLFRILEEGVKGTAMPPFRRFSDAEIHGLVDYVRLLSIRGQLEERMVLEILDMEGPLVADVMAEAYAEIWEKWNTAEESYFYFDGEIPEPTEEMLARGRELYNDATSGNCASCHGETGLGNGPAAYVTDEEGAIEIGPDGRPVSAYQDDWGNPIYPRNLTQRMYRGGDRPIDIYRRIYAGINGTPMPAIGESKDADGNLVVPPDDMWALVFYVKSLSNGADMPLVAHASDGHGHGDGHGHDDDHGGHDDHSDGHSGDHGEEGQ